MCACTCLLQATVLRCALTSFDPCAVWRSPTVDLMIDWPCVALCVLCVSSSPLPGPAPSEAKDGSEEDKQQPTPSAVVELVSEAVVIYLPPRASCLLHVAP